MRLEDQVVGLELAKKLKELGVKQESLFYWQELELREWEIEQNVEKYVCVYSGDEPCLEEDISAFTVAELGEMLPDTVRPQIGKLYGGQHRHLKIDKSDGDCWFVAYLPLDYEIDDETDNHMMSAEDTLADAMAKMLIYLIENGLYEPQK